MKKTLSFLIASMLFAVNSGAINIEAPTYPDWVTPDSGGVYYIYNVEADMWMSTASNNSTFLKLNVQGHPILVQKFNGDKYCLKWNDSDYYIDRIGSITVYSKYYKDHYVTSNYSVVSNGDVYNIQSHQTNTSYYNADQWLGWAGETSDLVYADCSLGQNTSWKFANAEQANHYCAERKLYDALTQNADFYAAHNLNVDRFIDIYTNRSTKSVDELNSATNSLPRDITMSTIYEHPYWSDYELKWYPSDGHWSIKSDSYGKYFYNSLSSNSTTTIHASVSVDQLSTLVYSFGNEQANVITVKVFIDNKEVRNLGSWEIGSSSYGLSSQYTDNSIGARFCEVLQPGTHTISWHFLRDDRYAYSPYCDLRNVGVMKSPLITVDLLEPGSLGTEVLYNTDHVKNVRRLKVKGEMNSDDLSKIKMMSTLLDLDLSEAKFKEIPENQFSVGAFSNDTAMQFLHALKLPEGLENIKENAFYGSFIDSLIIPSTVTTVGAYAFYYSHIKELNLPDNLTNFIPYYSNGNYYTKYFSNMFWLEKAKLPKNLTTIPSDCFINCVSLTDVVMPEKLTCIDDFAFDNCINIKTQFPEGLKTIGSYAFYGCYKNLDPKLPESLESIGNSAFWNCNAIDSLFIPKNVSYIGGYAFENCYGMQYAEVSSPVYSLASSVFKGCTKLTTLRLNSPTVVSIENTNYYPIEAARLNSVDLIVPNFIVNNYKLDSYWYNFKSVTGFDTNEIQDWTINNPLTLNHERMEGNPNIAIAANSSRLPSLKINGTKEQSINNLSFHGYCMSYYYNYPGQILSNSDKVTVNGNINVNLFTTAKRWYFFSLPFDVKISDITFDKADTQFAIRYYDGAGRAENGKTGNWKNYDKENDIIPAGTGFIIQTNQDSWNYFHAVNNEMKQNVVSNKEFVKTLAVNDSETPSNKGWNLVGNPYQCYYNTHCLNFTAPITVWNVSSTTYTAYSITDDDYALNPNEAFFVQCPNAELNTISFPTQGRQLNAVIESQNAVKATEGMFGRDRQIIDITVSAGEMSDRTRVVINEKAKMDYEYNCDASKFFSDESATAQIYTIGTDGIEYAINERPLEDGNVALGLKSNGGTFTIEMTRCQAEKVYLNDLQNNISICLNDQSYTFNTEGGTIEGRFTISMTAGATSITKTDKDINADECEVYSLTGVKMAESMKNLKPGIYVINGKKVMVK